MKKRRLLIYLIIIILLAVGGFFAYKYFFEGETVSTILPAAINKTEDIDVYNGIYVYRDYLKKTYNIINKCSVSSNDKIIVVYGDKYRMYSGNCLLMKYLGVFDNNLSFKLDGNKKYYIEFDGDKYIKDDEMESVKEGNFVVTNLNSVNFAYLGFIIKNTEKAGEYYQFSTAVKGFPFPVNFNASLDTFMDQLIIEIGGSGDRYSKFLNSTDDFPNIMLYKGNMVIIEKNNNAGGNFGNLYVYNNDGKKYSFNDNLPIIVNDVAINSTWYSIFRYDATADKFYVLFSKDSNMCNEGKKSSYYEFSLDYDYKSIGFNKPNLASVGSTGKGACSYVQKYYLKG